MRRQSVSKRAVFYAPEGVDAETRESLGEAPAATVVEATGGRPSLAAVAGGLRAGDVLIVQTLRDLGSHPRAALAAIEGLQQRGVRVRVLRDGLDSSAPSMSQVLKGLRLAAELMEGAVREDWRREIAAAREEGAFRTGRPRRLSLVDVAELRAQGLGAAEIAARLEVSRWSVYRRLKELDGEG